MARKASGNTAAMRPLGGQIFRYWVAVRDLRDGSVRTLPLSATRKVYFPAGSEAQRAAEDSLRVEDGADTLEARNLDELAALLRVRYPDPAYERRLHAERDLEAERRRADAMQELIRIVARAAYKSLARG